MCIDEGKAMYRLYQWYAWEFGKWVEIANSTKLSDLRSLIKGKPTLTYKIEKDGALYERRIGKGWRRGMALPT